MPPVLSAAGPRPARPAARAPGCASAIAVELMFSARPAARNSPAFHAHGITSCGSGRKRSPHPPSVDIQVVAGHDLARISPRISSRKSSSGFGTASSTPPRFERWYRISKPGFGFACELGQLHRRRCAAFYGSLEQSRRPRCTFFMLTIRGSARHSSGNCRSRVCVGVVSPGNHDRAVRCFESEPERLDVVAVGDVKGLHRHVVVLVDDAGCNFVGVDL